MRADPGRFRALDLRAHEILSDAPLHDVWTIRLRGGDQNLTMPHVRSAFGRLEQGHVNLPARMLFGLRRVLGKALGWDEPPEYSSARSYVNRLSSEDRARSLEEPGSTQGFGTLIYAFDNEVLSEVINRTVHAFLLFALEPDESGHTVYWAIYVKPVSGFTRVYMAMIDPFRRWLIYPSLIRRFENAWERRTLVEDADSTEEKTHEGQ